MTHDPHARPNVRRIRLRVAAALVGMLAALLTGVIAPAPASAAATVGGWGWGLGSSGQLGNSGTASFSYPAPITSNGALNGRTVTAVTAGVAFACALAHDGNVANTRAYCWGLGTGGQLGNGSLSTSLFPVAVGGALASLQVAQISAGNDHACAVTVAGVVYCWGTNASGQLGNGSTTLSAIPVAITGGTLAAAPVATAVATGTSFSCAITPASATKVHCWGVNTTGQVGDGTPTTRTSPVAVTGTITGTTPAGISSGAAHSCVVTTLGLVKCWGLGTSGQLGNNGLVTATAAVNTVGVPATANKITASGAHSCASTSDGLGYCWGLGTSGQLGNLLATTSSSAVQVYTGGVLSGKTITSIRAGALNTCAVTSDGGGYCWGAGTSGANGNYTSAQANEAVPVYTGTVATGPGTFQEIAVGTSYAVAVFSRASAPAAPTIATVTSGDGTLTVTVAAPADTGGSPITAYTVTSSTGATCAPILPALSCTITGLTNGTSYSFTATATNAVGVSDASTPSSPATPMAPPGPPTSVTAVAGLSAGVAVGSGTAIVSWTAPVATNGSAVTGYTVTVAPAGPAGCTAVAPSLTCTITGLTDGTAYAFTVTATNGAGDSIASAASAPVTPATTPAVPTSVSAAAGKKSATVTWGAPASSGGSVITSYTAVVAPGGASCTTTATSCTITGLDQDTAYTATVRAVNAVGNGDWSAAVAVAPLAAAAPAVPGAPTGVTATAGDGAATITWIAPAGTVVTSYTVTSVPGDVTCTTTGTGCTITGLINGTPYTFIVTAGTTSGVGPASSPSTPVVPSAAPAPEPVVAAVTVAGQVTQTARGASTARLSGTTATPRVLVRVFKVVRGEHLLLGTARSGATGQWKLAMRIGRVKTVKVYAMVGASRTRTTTVTVEDTRVPRPAR